MATATHPQSIAAIIAAATPAVTVPPLDDELAGLLDDLTGIHRGIDLIRAGVYRLATAPFDRDQTQTILATLGGSADNTDILTLLGLLIARLTNADATPCLRELPDDEQDNVRRIGEAVAVDMQTTMPRDLVAETCIRIDPYSGAQPAWDGGEDR